MLNREEVQRIADAYRRGIISEDEMKARFDVADEPAWTEAEMEMWDERLRAADLLQWESEFEQLYADEQARIVYKVERTMPGLNVGKRIFS